MIRPIDCEHLVARALSAAGLAAGPSPVPTDLGDALPYAVVWQVGGSRESMVLDRFSLSVDVYAATDADASSAASMAAGIIAGLPYSTGEVQWRDASVDTLPYANPDPLHEGLARWTLAASVAARAEIID